MPAQSNRPYWWQFLFIGLGMVMYTMCRTGFPVGLSAMGKEFQWTAFQAGALRTIFLLGQALIDIPAGYWADRLDRKWVIFIGLFGLGFFTALVTLASGFWSALIYRVLFRRGETRPSAVSSRMSSSSTRSTWRRLGRVGCPALS
jgi:MFS family permease